MVRWGSPVQSRPSAPSENCAILLSFADVAQLVEHFTRNEEVAGSIPAIGSSFYIGAPSDVCSPLQLVPASVEKKYREAILIYMSETFETSVPGEEYEYESTSLSDNPTDEDIFQALQQEGKNKLWCENYMAEAKEVMGSALATQDMKERAGIGYAQANMMLGSVEERIEEYESLRTPKEKLN